MTQSTNNPPATYAKQVSALQALVVGLTKHRSALPTIVIDGKSYQADDFLAPIQARLAATQAVPPARAAWRKTVAADQTERQNTEPLIAGLKQTLLVAYASQVDVLADFGLVPRKTRVVSPATQVVAAQKAKATRAVRHTMSPKQKAGIKGDVSTVTVTAGASSGATVTAVASAAPATAPSSAPTPPAGTATPPARS